MKRVPSGDDLTQKRGAGNPCPEQHSSGGGTVVASARRARVRGHMARRLAYRYRDKLQLCKDKLEYMFVAAGANDDMLSQLSHHATQQLPSKHMYLHGALQEVALVSAVAKLGALVWRVLRNAATRTESDAVSESAKRAARADIITIALIVAYLVYVDALARIGGGAA
jgi:hypothetical protein